jgi:hypothetical protein
MFGLYFVVRTREQSMKRPAWARKSKRMLNPIDPSSQYPQNNPPHPTNQSNPNSPKHPSPQPALAHPIGSSPRYTWKSYLIFFLFVLGMSLILGLVFFFCLVSILSQPPPAIFYQGDLLFGFSGVDVLVGGGMVVLLLICLAVVARGRRSKPLGNLVKGLFALLLIVAFCSLVWFVSLNPSIDMTRTGFLRTATVNINDGHAIDFSNSNNGVTQILCVGVDQHCQPSAGDPPQLDCGLVIQPGQTVSVVFDFDGEYQLTSKTTPHMNITVSVRANEDGGGDSGSLGMPAKGGLMLVERGPISTWPIRRVPQRTRPCLEMNHRFPCFTTLSQLPFIT